MLSAGMIGGKDNGNAEDNTTIPASKADHAKSDAWNPAIIIIIGICILLIVSGAVIFVRKKSGSEEELVANFTMKQQIVTKAALRDGEQATEYDMPQEDKEKTPEKYETVSLDDLAFS